MVEIDIVVVGLIKVDTVVVGVVEVDIVVVKLSMDKNTL